MNVNELLFQGKIVSHQSLTESPSTFTKIIISSDCVTVIQYNLMNG